MLSTRFALILCLLALLMFLLSACSERVVKEAVYIPTKADLEIKPLKPRTNNSAQDVINILEYTNQLEKDVKFLVK